MVAAAPKKVKVRPQKRLPPAGHWTFLTNHATILLHVACHPEDTMRSIATTLGLTERTTAAAIADLRDARYIAVRRRGRHNHYTINSRLPLRREAHSKLHVRDLVDNLAALMADGGKDTPREKRSPRKRMASA